LYVTSFLTFIILPRNIVKLEGENAKGALVILQINKKGLGKQKTKILKKFLYKNNPK